MALFSKRKENRQEGGDQTTGEASGEGPRRQQCRRALGPQETAIGATTLPSADAMRHSTFDAEVGVSYILEHHALSIEK